MFGTFIGSTSGYRFYTISDSTKSYYVDDSRGQYRCHPILFRPLSSKIDYLSTETFQFHVESTVWDHWKEDLLTLFCYFAPVIRHSVQTMCTMFSRKDFFRLFGGLLRISSRKTNANFVRRPCWSDLRSETPRIGPRISSGKPLFGFD